MNALITVTDMVEGLGAQAAIVDTVYAYATAVDTRDWDLYRSLFTDEIEVDFTSYNGGEAPTTTSADTWVADVRRLFLEFDATQHFMSNPRITREGTSATCVMYVLAEHVATRGGNQLTHTIAGYYTDHLVQHPTGWKISRVKLTVLWTRGDARLIAPTGER